MSITADGWRIHRTTATAVATETLSDGSSIMLATALHVFYAECECGQCVILTVSDDPKAGAAHVACQMTAHRAGGMGE